MTDLQSLSEREIEILKLLATGKSNKQIAHDLQISTNTVKVHVRNIFGKLEVASRTEASMVAVRAGLIETGAVQPAVEEDAEEDLPAAAVPVETAPPAVLTETASTPSAPTTQTWILAGMFVTVTLLVVIAFRLFNQAAQPAATPSPEAFAIESQWQNRPALPEPRSRAAAAAVENAVYVIGGLIDGLPSADLSQLDTASGAWSALAPKPTAVSEIRAAVIGGLIYVPGGRLATGEMSAGLEIYDPQKNVWTAGPDLPAAVGAYALAAYEGKLFLFGGHDGEDYTDRVYIFDPDREAWSEATPMPARLGFAGAAVVGSRVYIIGGFDGDAAADTTLVYSPAQENAGEPWDAAAAMPEGRYAMGLVNIADKIHLIGGQGGAVNHFTQMDYTPQTDIWQLIDNPLAGEWSHLAAVPLGTEIFVLGGEIDGEATDRSLSYQVLFVVVIPVVPSR